MNRNLSHIYGVVTSIQIHISSILEITTIKMENKGKCLGIIAIAAIAGLLIATSAVGTDNAFASKNKYGKSQALAQANSCGNEYLPMNVGCQNSGSQIQGEENGAALAGIQQFPGQHHDDKKHDDKKHDDKKHDDKKHDDKTYNDEW